MAVDEHYDSIWNRVHSIIKKEPIADANACKDTFNFHEIFDILNLGIEIGKSQQPFKDHTHDDFKEIYRQSYEKHMWKKFVEKIVFLSDSYKIPYNEYNPLIINSKDEKTIIDDIWRLLIEKHEHDKHIIQMYTMFNTAEFTCKSFLSEYYGSFERIVAKFKTLKLYDALKGKTIKWINEHMAIKNTYTAPNKSYLTPNLKQHYLISIDIKKANATVLFYLLPLMLFHDQDHEGEHDELSDELEEYTEEHRWDEFTKDILPEFFRQSKKYRQCAIVEIDKHILFPIFNQHIIDHGIKYLLNTIMKILDNSKLLTTANLASITTDECVIDLGCTFNMKKFTECIDGIKNALSYSNILKNFTKITLFRLNLENRYMKYVYDTTTFDIVNIEAKG